MTAIVNPAINAINKSRWIGLIWIFASVFITNYSLKPIRKIGIKVFTCALANIFNFRKYFYSTVSFWEFCI